MKNFVTLLFLLVFGISFSTSAQTVSVDDIFSNKGSEISIPIKITDITSANVAGAQFVLEYDTSILEITGISKGSVVTDPAATIVSNNTVRAPGIGEYRVGISTQSNLVGSGTLATVTARVKNYGRTSLNLVNVFLDSNSPTINNGSVDTSIPITLSGPDKLDQGATSTYTVSVGDLNGRDISAFQVFLAFDNSLIDISNVQKGAILSNTEIVSNVLTSELRVANGTQNDLSGSGVLFTFDATAKATATGVNTFTFNQVLFNNGAANGRETNTVTTPTLPVQINNFVFITLEPNSVSKTLNGTSIIDIASSDLTAENVISYQFILDYPENSISIENVEFLTDLNASVAGQSNIVNGVLNGAASASTNFNGAGNLVRLTVKNLAKGTHTLSFNSFRFDNGVPLSSTGTIELVVDNDAPSAPSITAPSSGDTVKVVGLPTVQITPTWSASTDANNDTLKYTWELSTSMNFSTVLQSLNTDTATNVTLSNEAVEVLLKANGVNTGENITLYHRATVTDGDATVVGAASAAVFSLGVVNTPVVAGSVITPTTNDTVMIMGLPTETVSIEWSSTSVNDTDDDVITYTWQLSTDMNFTSIADSFTGTDTVITRTNAQLKSLVGNNDTLTVYHRVIYSDGESTSNSTTERVVFISGVVNTPPTATAINAPSDSSIVTVVGLPTDTITPMWTASTDADNDTLRYTWELNASPNFEAASTLASFSADTNTSVTLPLSTVDSILSGAGYNIGDTVRVYHRAVTTDGIAIVEGNSATVWFIRGLVNTPPTSTEITAPANGVEITIQGDPTAPFTPRWSVSTDADGDNVSYVWQLSTSFNFASESILFEAPVTGTQVDLTVEQVAAVLDAAGAQVGVPVTLYHRAQTTDGKVTVNGVSKSVVLIRGTLTNIDTELPLEFALDQNYPNPFNPVTTINYAVSESRMVSVKIYDMLGREVATLVNEVQPAGNYSIPFDASRLSTGIYIYRMVSGDFVQTRKMTLMK